GRLLHPSHAAVSRYDPDGATSIVGTWADTAVVAVPLGTRVSPGDRTVTALVTRTGRPARVDDYSGATGTNAKIAREYGFRSAVGVPVSVAGRLWGIIGVTSTREPLPADTEARLVAFAELAGTALANAEAQAALTASRARIVAAADRARRRIERDLHDGAQQRLVTLALRLREAQATAPPGTGPLVRQLDEVAAGLEAALEELRAIARGIPPAVLATGGLGPALGALARRCPVPVDLRVQAPGRLPGPVEIAAYYVASEAL